MTRNARATTLGNRQLYPHLVVDWLACEYDRSRDIYGSERECGTPRLFDVRTISRRADLALRIAVIEHAVRLSARTRRRLCAVFARHDVVFIEPDGHTIDWPDEPTGGVILDAFAKSFDGRGRN